jgi:N-acetylmuramoyl-L-alanine amidase
VAAVVAEAGGCPVRTSRPRLSSRATPLVALALFLAAALLAPALEVRAVAAQPAGEAAEDELLIRLPEGRGQRQVPSLHLDRNRPYVAAGDVAEILRATSYWRSETRKLLLRIGEHRLTLTVDNSFVILDGAVHRLPTLPRYRVGQVWMPLAIFDVLAEAGILPAPTWDPERRLLALGAGTGSVGSFGFREGDRMSVLTIPVSDGVSPSIRSSSRGRFIVRLRGAAVEPERLRTHEAAGRFAWVELGEAADGVDVEFAVSRTCRGFLVRRLASPPRIEIMISDRVGSQGEFLFRPFHRPGGTKPRTDPEDGTPLPFVPRSAIVVLDPGHGGDDVGTRSPGGLVEKHLSLELAARVRRHLEGTGTFRVVLVRERDERVEVPRRVELANTSGADLLLSLHVDLASAPAARRTRLAVRTGGGQVVYEDLAPLVPGALAASEVPENLLLERWEAAGSGRGTESYRAAQKIARALGRKFPSLRTEVVKLPAWNLEGARMPGVLIELAPPGGGSADRALGSGENLESMAGAIAAGVAAYWQGLSPRPSPSTDDSNQESGDTEGESEGGGENRGVSEGERG